MQAWTIDNYDGPESYEELGIEMDEHHKQAPPLEVKKFHQMRTMMNIVEAEMDEIFDPDNHVSRTKREEQLHQMKKTAISICDDYMLDGDAWSGTHGVQPDQTHKR